MSAIQHKHYTDNIVLISGKKSNRTATEMITQITWAIGHVVHKQVYIVQSFLSSLWTA